MPIILTQIFLRYRNFAGRDQIFCTSQVIQREKAENRSVHISPLTYLLSGLGFNGVCLTEGVADITVWSLFPNPSMEVCGVNEIVTKFSTILHLCEAC